MVVKFQNPSGNTSQAKVVIVQQNTRDEMPTIPTTRDKTQTDSSHIEGRQNKSNKVLEQFIREAKRRGDMTDNHENRIQESFRLRQEAKEQRLRGEERQKQLMLDRALTKKLQEEEEKQYRQCLELEEKERLHIQQQ